MVEINAIFLQKYQAKFNYWLKRNLQYITDSLHIFFLSLSTKYFTNMI